MSKKSINEQTGENNFSIKDEFARNNEQFIADEFIFDLKKKRIAIKKKKIILSSEDANNLPEHIFDSFPEILNAEIQGKELTIKHDEDNNHYLFADNVQIIQTNDKHEITELYLPTTKEIPNYFLINNKALETLSMPMYRVSVINFYIIIYVYRN